MNTIKELTDKMRSDDTMVRTTRVERGNGTITATSVWRNGEKAPHGATTAAMVRDNVGRGEQVKLTRPSKTLAAEGFTVRVSVYAVSAR